MPPPARPAILGGMNERDHSDDPASRPVRPPWAALAVLVAGLAAFVGVLALAERVDPPWQRPIWAASLLVFVAMVVVRWRMWKAAG